MVLVTATNYTDVTTQFAYPTDDGDPFDTFHWGYGGRALDQHDHRSGRGLGVRRLQTAVAPTGAGEVAVIGNALQWWGATAGAVRTAADLEGTQTIAGLKTFSSATINHTRTGAVTGDYWLTAGAQSVSNQYGLYNNTAGRYEWYTTSAGVLVAPQGIAVTSNTMSVGGTVPPWQSGYRLLAVGSNASVVNSPSGTATYLVRNAYWDGATWRYTIAESSEIYQQSGGVHYFLTAGSGSADAAMTPTTRMTVSNNGTVGVGSGASSAFMTTGVCIDQGTGGFNELLTFKATGTVAHGVTNYADTATCGSIYRAAASGGLNFRAVATAVTPLLFQTFYGTDDTGKGLTSNAATIFDHLRNSPPTIVTPTANANVFAVRSNSANLILIDVEGDMHMNTTTVPNAYDEHDDPALGRALRLSLLPAQDPLRQRFAELIERYRPVIAETGLVTYNDDGHHFLNIKRVSMFTLDAIHQLAERVSAQALEIDELRRRLALAGV